MQSIHWWHDLRSFEFLQFFFSNFNVNTCLIDYFLKKNCGTSSALHWSTENIRFCLHGRHASTGYRTITGSWEPTREETKTRRKPPRPSFEKHVVVDQSPLWYVVRPIQTWSYRFGKSVDSFRSTNSTRRRCIIHWSVLFYHLVLSLPQLATNLLVLSSSPLSFFVWALNAVPLDGRTIMPLLQNLPVIEM